MGRAAASRRVARLLAVRENMRVTYLTPEEERVFQWLQTLTPDERCALLSEFELELSRADDAAAHVALGRL